MAKAAEKAAETKKQRQNKAKVEAESLFRTELPSGLGSTTHTLGETRGQNFDGAGPPWDSLIPCPKE